MTQPLPKREDVPVEHTWALESIFATPADWEAEAVALEAKLPALAAYQGKLTRSARRLLQWLTLQDELKPRVWRFIVYVSALSDGDTTNQTHAAMVSRAYGLLARIQAATAFADPELLKLDPARFEMMVAKEPGLAVYRQYFNNLWRTRAHVRNAEVEAVLAQASDALSTASTVYGILTDAELSFKPAVDSQGRTHEVAQGTLGELLHSRDRELRRSAFESYSDGHLAFKATLASIYSGQIKGSVFRAATRNYPSTLEAALHDKNLTLEVYHNVIDACNRHLPIWHRYWEIRRRALGLERAASYDIWAPLVEAPVIPYAQAVDMIVAGMAPLGADYVDTVRRGCLEERWVDIYPNQGKRSGAYSSGAYGTRPFILMSYSDQAGLSSMSTLAHELGHSMHSHLSNATQPPVYADYSLFVAEVASNFNQALVRAHLIRTRTERDFQIALIEEAMQNFHRYLFLMPILSQWEQWAHAEIGRGGALAPDAMNAKLADLFTRGYGPAMVVDGQRDGILWATFPHFYVDFYVFQYASGIAAANALAAIVDAGDLDTRDRYLQFLRTGSSLYPLDALKLTGLDLTQPEPMDRAFKVLEGFVERLDGLV